MTDELPDDPGPRSPAAIRFLTTFVVPFLILSSAVFCAGAMVAMRPDTERAVAPPAEVRVEARPLVPETQPASVEGSGTVIGARQVRITPEVSGRVVSMNERLVPGGRLQEGEVLLQLDSRDHRAAVAQQEQAVARARLELELERNRGEVAVREWDLLGDPERAGSSLALREPHLVAAQRGLEAAEAALAQAQANLGRTRITAPFNGLILEEAVDIGQVVQPGAAVATLVGTDAFWVQVSLPLEKLDGMRFASEGGQGSPAVVTHRLGAGRTVQREGVVKQLMGQLDPQTRTAQVIVEIPDPLGQEGLPLLPGAFVDVAIEGRPLSDTWEIPRTALEDAEYVWVVDRESALRKRQVQIGWRTREAVVVTSGIEPGDRLLTSPLALPIDGQIVTVTGDGEAG